MEKEERQVLHTAARYGDMDILREALATWPVEDFFTLSATAGGHYNIMHIAVLSLQEEFLGELIDRLPSWAVHSLISQQDITESRLNAIHYAASRGVIEILRLLLNFYRSSPSSSSSEVSLEEKPWVAVDVEGQTALLRAHEVRKEECALEIMSMDMELLCNMVDYEGNNPLFEAVGKGCPKVAVKILTSGCSYSTSGNDELTPLDLAPNSTESLVLFSPKSALYCAVSHGCDQVVEKMLTLIEPLTFRRKIHLVKNSDDNKNVLHAASNCTERTANLLMDKLPWLINEPDDHRERPLDVASAVGTPWLIELLLKRDPPSIDDAPYAWTYACKNGHLVAMNAFINNCPDFRELCIKKRNTPLHHIKLRAYSEYKDFIAIPMIEEMKNIADFEGKTPLHRAIGCNDIIFTEVLLTTDGVDRSIKDNRRKTATDLLVELCDQDGEWDAMCKRIGINPRLKTTYIQPTNHNLGRLTAQGISSTPGEMRRTLSVVAALLATLTFDAGFTLPGGFNNGTGNAILTEKASFLVFILADTYAMCCAMLVLFCFIWSMVCDNDKSLLLIDRACSHTCAVPLWYTGRIYDWGVPTVLSHKSLWAAILVFVMCSLVALSANRTILYKLLDKLIPSSEREVENHAGYLEEVRCFFH